MKKVLNVVLGAVLVLSVLLGSTLTVCADVAVNEICENTTTSVFLTEENDTAIFIFTPTETAVYNFRSIGDEDTMGGFFETDGTEIDYSDDSAFDLNFSAFALLEAGQTYILSCTLYDFESSDVFFVSLQKTDIQSVNFNDITVYKGIDSYLEYEYDYETGEIIGEYLFYDYYPSYSVTLTNGDILYSDEYGCIEYDGETYDFYAYDDQDYYNQWDIGDHLVYIRAFGFDNEFKVTVKDNPIKNIEIDDVTVYEDWDCITIDEDWEEILGVEITTPIKIYYYMPSYTVYFNDGTKLTSDKYGMVEYNGSIYDLTIDGDSQDINNLWQVGGSYQSSGTVLGLSDTFTVNVEANPMQSIQFDDITLRKDLDCFYDYDFNPNTGEYDLKWKHYEYTPSYTITLKDGTVLKSDEYGNVEYDGKEYIFLGFNDGQSYENQWKEGSYNVTVKAFGAKCSFNVILGDIVSVSGDINNDGKINNKDLGLLMQYLNSWDVMIDVSAADVTYDGNINNKDLGLLMQYLNGWDVTI